MPYKTLWEALRIHLNADFINEVTSWPPSYLYAQIQTPIAGASEERKKILRELCLHYDFVLPPWLYSNVHPRRKLPNTDFSNTGKDKSKQPGD